MVTGANEELECPKTPCRFGTFVVCKANSQVAKIADLFNPLITVDCAFSIQRIEVCLTCSGMWVNSRPKAIVGKRSKSASRSLSIRLSQSAGYQRHATVYRLTRLSSATAAATNVGNSKDCFIKSNSRIATASG